MLWEPEHRGAQTMALDLGARIYWNAPTREDDTAGQIALVQRVSSEDFQGLILAPDQVRALITPVRRAMQHGLTIVVVGSPLPIPAGGRLSYVLNDEDGAGRIAGKRLAAVLHGQGEVAILGVNQDIAGNITRSQSLEQFLTTDYPRIHVVKKIGSFNLPHEQQVASETIKEHPDLDAIVALTWTSALGAFSAIGSTKPEHRISIIAFDPDSLNFQNPNLDSVVIEDIQRMGSEGVREIVGKLHGARFPDVTRIQPFLVTRDNMNTPEVQQLTSVDWRPERVQRAWRIVR
jgi:ribose transport system substrate-binding protein